MEQGAGYETVQLAEYPVVLLLRNVGWFCQLRWLVIASLIVYGMSGLLVPQLYQWVHLIPQKIWPIVCAGVLILMNLVYLFHNRSVAHLPKDKAVDSAVRNLWGQIVIDLAVLTVAIHYIGSLCTPVAFTYLFHVVLACIFFPRRHSFVVTLIAIHFFLICVALEVMEIIDPSSVLSGLPSAAFQGGRIGEQSFHLAFTVMTMLVVWFLGSQLSGLLQQRNRELIIANHRLECLQKEKMRHMLRTTHELKAPFAAIHANLQLLLKGYCGELPTEAIEVLESTARRARMLSDGIKDMLQLANLHEESGEVPMIMDLDLAEIVRWCVEQSRQVADEKNVIIDATIDSVAVRGNDDHLKMLFTNLIFNAINYSHRGGHVRVAVTSADGCAEAVIADQGIGIPAEKLPHIFEEYFRTREAMKHNPESTGLGLSIVRRVAARHGTTIYVESENGQGTSFKLVFPCLKTRELPGEII